MKNLTWQNPEQLFVAQELINKVKSKCCGIKVEGSDGPKMIPWGPKIETGYLGIPQLYDMKQAGEKVNLATEHPEKVFELQQILRKVRDKSIQMK